jgi:hypothetical protein
VTNGTATARLFTVGWRRWPAKLEELRGPKLKILRLRRLAELFSCCAILACFAAASSGAAQNAAIDDLKGKIFDAHMAQQSFPGLKYCGELNGKSFYFQQRDRVLKLDDYYQSLENLVKAGVYNPAKRRAWTAEDAAARREEVQKQAQGDQQKCELVRNLPDMEKQLQELQKNAAASDK